MAKFIKIQENVYSTFLALKSKKRQQEFLEKCFIYAWEGREIETKDKLVSVAFLGVKPSLRISETSSNWGGLRENSGRKYNQVDNQVDNQDENQVDNQVGIKIKSSPFISNKNISNKNISNKKSIDEILDGMDENYKPIVEDWLKYKKERGESYKPIGLKKMIENLVKMSENSPVLARAIVDRSITNNWAGLFELKPDEKEKALKFENNKKQDLILDLETLANAKDEERKNWSSEQWDIYYKVVFGIESMDRRNGNV